MDKNYGKIKNGKLLLASNIISRDGNILIHDESIYLKCGYKRIIYTAPPPNKDEYDLFSTWEENEESIVQVWKYQRIPDDFSGDLFLSIRDFIMVCNELIHQIEDNYKKNEKEVKEILENNRLIRLIYYYKSPELSAQQLLSLYCESHDFIVFFEELGIKHKLEENGFKITSDAVHPMTEDQNESNAHQYTEVYFEGDKVQIERNPFDMFYIKSLLSGLSSLESYTTPSNLIMYSMAFIYLYTAFDEILLKMIRIICMHEKKWVMSNNELSAKEILKCTTIDEVYLQLIDNKINQLGWESYTEKINYFKNRGITIDDDNRELFDEILLYLACKRNILVHNNGIWNRQTVDKLKNTQFYNEVEIDKALDYSLASFKEATSFFIRAIKYLYESICDKFHFLNLYIFNDCLPEDDGYII